MYFWVGLWFLNIHPRQFIKKAIICLQMIVNYTDMYLKDVQGYLYNYFDYTLHHTIPNRNFIFNIWYCPLKSCNSSQFRWVIKMFNSDDRRRRADVQSERSKNVVDALVPPPFPLLFQWSFLWFYIRNLIT